MVSGLWGLALRCCRVLKGAIAIRVWSYLLLYGTLWFTTCSKVPVEASHTHTHTKHKPSHLQCSRTPNPEPQAGDSRSEMSAQLRPIGERGVANGSPGIALKVSERSGFEELSFCYQDRDLSYNHALFLTNETGVY